jgi:hypothetical protein
VGGGGGGKRKISLNTYDFLKNGILYCIFSNAIEEYLSEVLIVVKNTYYNQRWRREQTR